MEIVYQTNLGIETDFEFQYLDEVVFGLIEHTNYFDGGKYQKLNISDSTIIVFSDYSSVKVPALKKYFNYLSKSYSLLHLSNEALNYDTSIYNNAKIVLRSYYDPNIKLTNIFSIPLGYKSGFKNNNIDTIDFSAKSNPWVFIGAIKSHRKKMIETFKMIPNDYNHYSTGWDSKDQLDVKTLISIYQKTIFSLCPYGGINPDTFRIMETLEWGCIPVVINFGRIDYYKFIYGDHPFILGKTWEDCKSQVEVLLNNKLLLLKKQEQVVSWYKNYKYEFMTDMNNLITQVEFNHQKLKSKQFKYQYSPGVAHLITKLYFALYFSKNKFIRQLHRIFN